MSYMYLKVDGLKGEPVVGSHQCVALVQIYAGAPVTTAWRQGEAVVGHASLTKGTAIATFVNGRYPNHSHGNHAAFFLREVPGGIWIMDQWKADGKKFISSRLIPSYGQLKNGKFFRASDNADAYFVIE